MLRWGGEICMIDSQEQEHRCDGGKSNRSNVPTPDDEGEASQVLHE
jgi:hypothetical protein